MLGFFCGWEKAIFRDAPAPRVSICGAEKKFARSVSREFEKGGF
jgi:hypothetical protein